MKTSITLIKLKNKPFLTNICFVVATIFMLVITTSYANEPFRTFSNAEDDVIGAYIAYYGRPADPLGMYYWADRLVEEGSLSSIIEAFGESEEFDQRFGSFDHIELVTNLYIQLLGRNPDIAGLNYYVNELNAGRMTLQSISLNILYGVQNEDITMVNNRKNVAKYYISQIEVLNALDLEPSAEALAALIAGVTVDVNIVISAYARVDLIIKGDKVVVLSISQFATITYPQGVVVDKYGNIYIQSLSLFDGGLLKFSQDGALLARNSSLSGKLRLVEDQVNGVIWGIEIGGMLYYIDPNTLQATPYMNISNYLMPYKESVFNIIRKDFIPIFMIDPKYGDIAIRHTGNGEFDLFVSGQTTAGGIPFVVRLRFQQQYIVPSILVASFPLPNPVVPPPLDTQSPGLAIAANGTVLTALPHDRVGEVSPFYLAAFDADYSETGLKSPDFLTNFFGKQAFTTGMTTSITGEGYYLVTVANGFGCGMGPAILYVPSDFSYIACVADLSSYGLGNMNPGEIAIGPNGNSLYVTMSWDGQVIRVDLQ